MNAHDFVKQYKRKNVDGIKLSKGDSLNFFGCKYEVVNSSGSKFVILKDERDNKLALPTMKVTDLVENGHATVNKTYLNGFDFIKARGVLPIKTKGSLSLRGRKPFPVGTVRTAPGGQSRLKVAEPDLWVTISEGTSHVGHDSKETLHPITHPTDVDLQRKVLSFIYDKAHKGDQLTLKDLFMDYAKEISSVRNLIRVQNTEKLDEKGKPISDHMSKEVLDTIHDRQEKAAKLYSNFKAKLRDSITKKLKEKE